MQTLWSRVAQVRGACRCPQCAPSVQGVTRRATASATRRMPRYLTSSTLWYSGIFAAAATFDAGAKQQRREKWDKAIAEVKQELAQPALARQEQQDEFDLRVEDGLEDETVHFMPFVGVEGGDEFRYSDGQTQAAWPANTGDPLSKRHLPLNSIYAEDWQRVNLSMYRSTPKKQAMVQTSVDILLLELIRELQLCDGHQAAAESSLPELRSTLLQDSPGLELRLYDKYQRMKILRRSDSEMAHYTLPEAPEERLPIPTDEYSLCRYREGDEHHFRSTQRDLTSSLQRLFKSYSEEQISKPSLLSKIIYSLRYSAAPPDLNAFNTLLLGFSRAEQPVCFRHVLSSFRRCHMRPNEITLATVLSHFTKIDDPARFAYWIELLRGGHNGLALARPDVRIDEESGKRLIHHPEDPERIIQLPYPTPIVFGAIIAGVAKFTGFESALQICQSMGQEGWGLCMAGLTPLLHDCVQRGDWNSGLAVWGQIQNLKAKSRRKEDSRWLSERIRLDTFAAMLRLCLKCDRRDVFAEVWASALKSHRGETEKLRLLIKGAGMKKSGDTVEENIARAVEARREGDRRFGIQRLVRKREEEKRELSRLPQRLVLPTHDVLAHSAEKEAFPLHQSAVYHQEPLLRLRRFLRNEDVLAVSQGEMRNDDVLAAPQNEAFPLHQLDIHLTECSATSNVTDETKSEPRSRDKMEYFEYAELVGPGHVTEAEAAECGARFATPANNALAPAQDIDTVLEPLQSWNLGANVADVPSSSAAQEQGHIPDAAVSVLSQCSEWDLNHPFHWMPLSELTAAPWNREPVLPESSKWVGRDEDARPAEPALLANGQGCSTSNAGDVSSTPAEILPQSSPQTPKRSPKFSNPWGLDGQDVQSKSPRSSPIQEHSSARDAVDTAPPATEMPQPSSSRMPKRASPHWIKPYGLDNRDVRLAPPSLPNKDQPRIHSAANGPTNATRTSQPNFQIRKHGSVKFARARDPFDEAKVQRGKLAMGIKATANAKKARLRSMQPEQLTEEELQGLMAAGPEVGEYETRERPMSLRA